MRDMSLLQDFVRLTTLEIEYPPAEDTTLFVVLMRLTQLKELQLIKLQHTVALAMLAVLWLTQLDSLNTTPHYQACAALNPVPLASELSNMKQLTKLCTTGALIHSSLSELTSLEHLEITIASGVRVPRSFRVHTHLRVLSLVCADELHLPPGIFAHFPKLQWLGIREVVMDDQLLPSIAALTQLTALNFYAFDDGKPVPQCTQVNLLSHLLRLTFLIPSETRPPSDYIHHGTLPRLQYLMACSNEETDSVFSHLRTKIPCLRRFIPHWDSYW